MQFRPIYEVSNSLKWLLKRSHSPKKLKINQVLFLLYRLLIHFVNQQIQCQRNTFKEHILWRKFRELSICLSIGTNLYMVSIYVTCKLKVAMLLIYFQLSPISIH